MASIAEEVSCSEVRVFGSTESVKRLKIEKNSEKGPGRPSYPPDDIAKAILMQQYLGMANRSTEGLVILFKEKVRLSTTFSYKTIERSYENPFVTLILNEVFKMTQEPISDKEHTFGIDGTCLPTSIKQNWETDKQKKPVEKDKKTKGYQKMITFVGTSYKMITAVTFPEDPDANESPYFIPMLRLTHENYRDIDLVAGDAAYISRINCTAVAGLGAIPRIYPKQGLTLKMKGSSAWAKMLLTLIDDPQMWLEEYHNRSICETVNSTFKRDFPAPLRKKLGYRKKQEAFTRVCDYDLKRLCYLKYLENLDIRVGS